MGISVPSRDFQDAVGTLGILLLDFQRFHTVAISTALLTLYPHVHSFVRPSLSTWYFSHSAGVRMVDVFRSKTPRSYFMK